MMNKNVRIAKELVKVAKSLITADVKPYTDSQIELLKKHGFQKSGKDYELCTGEFTLKHSIIQKHAKET